MIDDSNYREVMRLLREMNGELSNRATSSDLWATTLIGAAVTLIGILAIFIWWL